jgi:tRNA (guanine37-N1)-methyltransferase
MKVSWVVTIKKESGEDLRQWLIDHSLLDRNMKIHSEKNRLLMPLLRELGTQEKKQLREKFQHARFEQQKMEMKQKGKPKDLFTALENSIPAELHEFIPKSFDIIGKLVVIEVPDELREYERLIGETILKIHPSIESVFQKVDSVGGEFRLRAVNLIAGEGSSETVHKENKCIFELDIKKVYFSPRLATEHERIASLVGRSERVLDMFAGIGPFSILIAKEKDAEVFAVDVNPAAVHYLKKNLKINKVQGLVRVFEGDIREIVESDFDRQFDRVIMNLPSEAVNFLPLALKILKENGVLHFYQFVHESDYPEQFLEDLNQIIKIEGRGLRQVLNIRKVRAYAPYIWHIGVDLLIE